MTDFALVDIEKSTPYLYAEGACSMEPSDISRAMGEAFGKVGAFIGRAGLQPAGPALSVYHDYSPDRMTFRAGFVVRRDDLSRASGDIGAAELPTGRAMRFTHVGPYATLRDDYAEAERRIAAEGLTLSAPTWELYLNDPETTPAEELLTEVHIRVE